MEQVKKLASSLLTEDRFWKIIENSNKGENLSEEIHKLTEDEIMGYQYWFDYFHFKSYKQDLWAVAYTVLGGCGDDGFDYFRFWLATRGKDVFMKALENADSLCDEFDDCEYPSWEEVSYIPNKIFEEKFGKDFYAANDTYDFGDLYSSRPEMDLEWEEDDTESIKRICPNTFVKWWDNDKF